MFPTIISVGSHARLCKTTCSFALCQYNLKTNVFKRQLNTSNRRLVQKVLGIETSCDDTACAVVDTDGNLLGESLKSQLAFHNANGGVIPPIAANLHKKNIVGVVDEALSKAGIKMEDIDAVATTVKPGMGAALEVGAAYGSYLSGKYQKPFIPIHHMEAHALAVRMARKDVEFPFLTLLISGGHTLLAVARSIDKFELLGAQRGIALGEVLDKVARRLKLLNLPEYRNMSGGRAIEEAAKKASDINEFEFPKNLMRDKSCDLPLSGITTYSCRLIELTEDKHGVDADATIPGVENFCAALQLHVAYFLCLKVQYAMTVVRETGRITQPNPFLVVSGGAACNQYFRDALGKVCSYTGFGLAVPPPKLCTDNGVMIAWNGVEKLLAGHDLVPYDKAKDVRIQPSCPLGVDIREAAMEYKYVCDFIKIEDLFSSPSQNSSDQSLERADVNAK